MNSPPEQNDNLSGQSFTARDFDVHALPKDRRGTRTRKGREKKSKKARWEKRGKKEEEEGGAE